MEVTDFDPNRKYSVRSHQHGLDLRYHYEFVQTSEGTRVDFQGELYTEGLRNKLMKPLIKQIIKKEDQDHLQHLKKFIESSSYGGIIRISYGSCMKGLSIIQYGKRSIFYIQNSLFN
ncbi:hypothetical protein [Halobacillus litoralis]|uniref:hypothetical protein n=1 Tax=Halobacillus litoralis TaxID=45668 RepID=UPI0035327083